MIASTCRPLRARWIGSAAGGRQHLVHRHRGIGQEATELERLIAVLGESVHAKRPFPLHRRQQRLPHTRQPLIPEAPRFSLDHANHTLSQNRAVHRFQRKS